MVARRAQTWLTSSRIFSSVRQPSRRSSALPMVTRRGYKLIRRRPSMYVRVHGPALKHACGMVALRYGRTAVRSPARNAINRMRVSSAMQVPKNMITASWKTSSSNRTGGCSGMSADDARYSVHPAQMISWSLPIADNPWESQRRAGAPTSEYPGSGDTTP